MSYLDLRPDFIALLLKNNLTTQQLFAIILNCVHGDIRLVPALSVVCFQCEVDYFTIGKPISRPKMGKVFVRFTSKSQFSFHDRNYPIKASSIHSLTLHASTLGSVIQMTSESILTFNKENE